MEVSAHIGLLQVVDMADLTDTCTAVDAIVHLPHVLRSVTGRSRKAAAVQQPLFEALSQAALQAVPSADLKACMSFPYSCLLSEMHRLGHCIVLVSCSPQGDVSSGGECAVRRTAKRRASVGFHIVLDERCALDICAVWQA